MLSLAVLIVAQSRSSALGAAAPFHRSTGIPHSASLGSTESFNCNQGVWRICRKAQVRQDVTPGFAKNG